MEITIQKTKLKANLIKTGEFKGNKYLQIMELWKEKEEDDWRFSKKSVTFNKDSINQLYSFLEENKEEIFKHLDVED